MIKKNFLSLSILAFCLIFSLLLLPDKAFGHKVNIFAFVEGDKIVTESYFNDGGPCKDSLIQVLDPSGKELLQGKTNPDGLFSFPIPQYTDLTLILTASMGHKAEYVLRAVELPKPSPASSIPAASPVSSAPFVPPRPIPEQPSLDKSGQDKIQKNADNNKDQYIKTAFDTKDLEQVRQVVKESVEEAVRPLMEKVGRLEAHKTSLTDIIGGIGYIFGIMGIILLIKKRD